MIGSIEENVIECVAEQLGILPYQVRKDADLENLGFDSLDKVELGLQLEEQFEITLSDDFDQEIKTVQDVINLVTKAMAS